MNIAQFIDENKAPLKKFIDEYLNRRIVENKDVQFFEDTLNRLFHFSTSGKMLRGLFILLIYSFYKPLSKDSKASYAAAAIELIQSSLLIHDDIIDNDELRRGNRTIFAQYKDFGTENNYPEADAYGRSQGICTGDIAIFTAFDLITKCSNDYKEIATLTSLFAKETHLVAIGEMIDVDMAANPVEPTVKRVLEMYKFKTARYSFSMPFAAGAILGGADIKSQTLLAKLGENAGILFQIHDDWLGLYGTEEQIGKPVGSDIRENKKTIYRALLQEALPDAEKNKINSQSITEVLALLKRYSIEEEAKRYKDCYENESKDIINELPFTQAQKDVLLEVVELVTQRKK